ncbi:hypothetical protein P9X10_02880 [Bacillus cereus]|nr:hypothetical protein [Bacillus cereus]
MLDKICNVEGCNEKQKAKGFCRNHYQVEHRKEKREKRKCGLCLVDGCQSESTRGKYFAMHFDNWITYGRANYLERKVKTPKPKAPCKAKGCENKSASKGYCQKHNYRLRTHGQLELPNENKVCKEDGCESKIYAKELCRLHYMRERARINKPKTDKIRKENKENKFISSILSDLDEISKENENYFKDDLM